MLNPRVLSPKYSSGLVGQSAHETPEVHLGYSSGLVCLWLCLRLGAVCHAVGGRRVGDSLASDRLTFPLGSVPPQSTHSGGVDCVHAGGVVHVAGEHLGDHDESAEQAGRPDPAHPHVPAGDVWVPLVGRPGRELHLPLAPEADGRHPRHALHPHDQPGMSFCFGGVRRPALEPL